MSMLDKLIDGYASIEVAKAQAAAERYRTQAANQISTLHDPEYVDSSESLFGGNYQIPSSGGSVVATISRSKTALLWGGLGLVTAVVIAQNV